MLSANGGKRAVRDEELLRRTPHGPDWGSLLHVGTLGYNLLYSGCGLELVGCLESQEYGKRDRVSGQGVTK